MSIESHFPREARDLIAMRGQDLITTLGLPAIRNVVSEVLVGSNVRNATESLTRLRLSMLNAGLLTTYASMQRAGIDAKDIPDIAYAEHQDSGASATDKIILRWMLGLTNKQVQNVLRSDDAAWKDYITGLREGLSKSAAESLKQYGALPLSLDGAALSWDWALAMMMGIGAQTLAIRGAEKSLYGKFFEKLVLGSVLSILGFTLVDPESVFAKSFWLSTQGEKRESDATAIWRLGEGVRFDIGFIGAGNPEVTLDKVSRFEREIEMEGVNHYMQTFIIVDSVGKNSRIPQLAEAIDGTIIQMSMNDWVRTLGEGLEQVLPGYQSPVANLAHSAYSEVIRKGVEEAPIESIFRIVASPSGGR